MRMIGADLRQIVVTVIVLRRGGIPKPGRRRDRAGARMNTTAGEIARRVGGVVVGDDQVRLTGVNGIREARPGGSPQAREVKS